MLTSSKIESQEPVKKSRTEKSNCNAPILQVRRRYCNVYTQVRNTLTYMLAQGYNHPCLVYFDDYKTY